MAGFDKEQRTELQQLFAKNFERQQAWFTVKFAEERAYYRQLIRDELADIREKLEGLDKRTDDAEKETLAEITLLKKRLTHAERQIALLSKQR